MEYKFNKQDIIDSLKFTKDNNIQVLLVDADSQKGFNYPYLLYIPQNPQSTLVMDCVNDYEEPMAPNTSENALAAEQIYSLFGDRRITSSSIPTTHEQQENEETTTARLGERIGRASNTISTLVGKSGLRAAPIMIPLIPGYLDDTLENCASELSIGTAKDVAPQIVKMIRNAQQLVTERTGVKLNNKIIAHGHSKSSTFADNFSALHPELVQATMLSGLQYSTLPIDEIKLQVVEETEKDENEKFQVLDGIPVKRITRAEFGEIVAEYTSDKKDHQLPITPNNDGTYSLPLNYPLGIADIEHYIDLSEFPGGKEEYKKIFTQVPKMLICGEKEEEVTGHFAYSSGKTLEGIEVKAGEDLYPHETSRKITEIERAGMHNRVLEYIAATRALFGKSANEKFRNYSQLCSVLGLETQQKIYEDVGHVDIYSSLEFGNDSKQYYEGIVSGTVPTLDDNGRAQRINPIYQLVRRYLVSTSIDEETKKKENLGDVSVLLQKVEDYLSSKGIPENANMDRVFDELSFEELTKLFGDETRPFSETEVEEAVESVPITAKDNAAGRITSDTKSINKTEAIRNVGDN